MAIVRVTIIVVYKRCHAISKIITIRFIIFYEVDT